MLSRSLSNKHIGLVVSLLVPILVLVLGFSLSQAFFNVTYNPPIPACNDWRAYRWEGTPMYCPGGDPVNGVNDSAEGANFLRYSATAIEWTNTSHKEFDWEYAPGYNYCGRIIDKLLYTGWSSHWSGNEWSTRVWKSGLNIWAVDVYSYTTTYAHRAVNGVNYRCPTYHQDLAGYRRCDNLQEVYNPWISEAILYDGPNDLVGVGEDPPHTSYPCVSY